jgi:hypothetical protein
VKLARLAWFALLLGCKPPPSVSEGSTPEPSVIVEPPGTAPACELVERHEVAFEVQEHDDWRDLSSDRGLVTFDDARAELCASTNESSDGMLPCSDAGRQVLQIDMEEYQRVILLVEPTAKGLRSIEISSWPTSCRCDCGSWAERLADDPMSIVVYEYEDVATEVHLEGDEIVEGCNEGDECQTACIGERYGSQRLLVFDDSLGLRESFIDTEVREDGEFDVRFAFEQGRLVAIDGCTQVLTD